MRLREQTCFDAHIAEKQRIEEEKRRLLTASSPKERQHIKERFEVQRKQAEARIKRLVEEHTLLQKKTREDGG